LVVEGGKSNQVLSQFDGPVTFNEKTKFNKPVKISADKDSASTTSGALVVTGGIGVGKTITAQNVTVGNVTIKGTTSEVSTTSGDLNITALEGNSVAIKTDTNITGDISIIGVTTITGNTDIIGNLNLTGSASTEGRISANYLDVPNVSPIGGIIVWPGASNTWPTANWRECNGQTLSKTTYPELFAIIGYQYGGSGDNFQLPNLTSRFVGGIGNSPLNTLGATGGNNNAVLPSHSHTAIPGSHSHSYEDSVSNLSGSKFGDEGESLMISNRNVARTTGDNSTFTISVSTVGIDNVGLASESQGITNQNLPPYMALYWIMRIK
jgi:microcystin-dependent protein